MISKEYKLYLKSDSWKNKRDLILKRDRYRCVKCFDDKNLQIHHLTYDRLFMEKTDDLITLCATCHSKEHKINVKNKIKKHLTLKKIKTPSELNLYKQNIYKDFSEGKTTKEDFKKEMVLISEKRKSVKSKKRKSRKIKTVRYIPPKS